MDDSLGADFPYSCDDLHTELVLQTIDGAFGILAALLAVIGLIAIQATWLIPVMCYGVARVVYLLVLIFLFSDFVNIGAIIGVVFSAVWSLVFFRTYKIVECCIDWCVCVSAVLSV